MGALRKRRKELLENDGIRTNGPGKAVHVRGLPFPTERPRGPRNGT
jgi:hypothetical protein